MTEKGKDEKCWRFYRLELFYHSVRRTYFFYNSKYEGGTKFWLLRSILENKLMSKTNFRSKKKPDSTLYHNIGQNHFLVNLSQGI